jgi:hypothetical protein
MIPPKKGSPGCWRARRGGTGKSLNSKVGNPTATRKHVLDMEAGDER